MHRMARAGSNPASGIYILIKIPYARLIQNPIVCILFEIPFKIAEKKTPVNERLLELNFGNDYFLNRLRRVAIPSIPRPKRVIVAGSGIAGSDTPLASPDILSVTHP